MIKKVTKKAGFVLAVAGAAVVGGAVTGFVQAAIPSSADGQVHTCYRNSASLTDVKGALRVIDSDAGQSCSSSETGLDFKQGGSNSARVVKDASGQVLGDLVGADGPSAQNAIVFNHSVNRNV